MPGNTVNNHIRYKKTGISKLLGNRGDKPAIITHQHNYIQYIKLLGTIALPINWFTDHCSMWVSKSNSAARVGGGKNLADGARDSSVPRSTCLPLVLRCQELKVGVPFPGTLRSPDNPCIATASLWLESIKNRFLAPKAKKWD